MTPIAIDVRGSELSRVTPAWSALQRWGIGILVGMAIFLLLFALSMQKALNHDENQFVASGAMLARFGALPFADYAYFHLPNLVFIYAALFKFSTRLLLVARFFSTLCATATVSLVFIYSLQKLQVIGRLKSIIVGLCLVAILVCSTAFWHGVGLAWNHDASILPAVVSVLVAIHAMRRRSIWLWALSGAFISLACGVRLTFAPMAVVVALAAAFAPDRNLRQRIASFVAVCAAYLVAMAPTIYCFAKAPSQFIWGNISYRAFPVPGAATFHWYDRFFIFGTRVIADTPSAFLFGAVVVLVAVTWQRMKQISPEQRYEQFMLVAAVFAAFLGGALPAPVFVQYFYAAGPFTVLAIASMLALLPAQSLKQTWFGWSLGVITAMSILTGWRGYQNIARSIYPITWYPNQIHAIGRDVARYSGKRYVVTLAPIIPLEGGGRIYPAFTNGLFSYRVAPLVPAELHKAQHLVGLQDVKRQMRKNESNKFLFLTGLEPRLESQLTREAEHDKLGFVVIRPGVMLWGHALPSPTTLPKITPNKPAPNATDADDAAD